MADRRKPNKKVVVSGRRSTDVFNHQVVADEIKGHFDSQFTAFEQRFNLYIEEDMKWKKRAEPMLVVYENSNWALRVFVSTMKVIGLVAGVVSGLAAAWFTIEKLGK